MALGRVPLFPAFHSLNGNSLPPSLVRSASKPPLTHLLDLGDIGESKVVPRHLQVFLTIRQAIWSQASATVSPHTIRVLGNTADTLILETLFGKSLNDDVLSPSQKRISALLIAAQIFLYIVIRQVPATSSLIRILCGRLHEALGDTSSVRETWTSHYPTLLWISFVGVLGTGSTDEKEGTQWYMSLLESTFRQVPDLGKGESREQGRLRHILSNFLWEESSCAPLLHIMFPNPEIPTFSSNHEHLS